MSLVIALTFLNKNDTNLFVQKPYLTKIYIEDISEEDINLKNHYRNKKIPDPIINREACNKDYVDHTFDSDIDFIDSKFEKINFVNVNYQPAIDSHLTRKI